mmetsp:Transcript_4292/g.6426  ORF Transcript_4292/g.6426 Transcript_4292/m.6426 type:complete len:205 (+) Transcript_4292:2640-3254(+)
MLLHEAGSPGDVSGVQLYLVGHEKREEERPALRQVHGGQAADENALVLLQPQGDRVDGLDGDDLAQLRCGQLGRQLAAVQQARRVDHRHAVRQPYLQEVQRGARQVGHGGLRDSGPRLLLAIPAAPVPAALVARLQQPVDERRLAHVGSAHHEHLVAVVLRHGHQTAHELLHAVPRLTAHQVHVSPAEKPRLAVLVVPVAVLWA